MGTARTFGTRRCAFALVASAAIAAAGAAPAYAKSTATNTLPVKLVVGSNCGITTYTLGFGTATNGQKSARASTTMVLNCTPGTVYSVTIDNGRYYDGTTRRMWGGQANGQVWYADYQLYRDSTYVQPWGSTTATASTGTIPATGQKTLVLYGEAQLKNVRAAPYLDVVTVTLDF